MLPDGLQNLLDNVEIMTEDGAIVTSPPKEIKAAESAPENRMEEIMVTGTFAMEGPEKLGVYIKIPKGWRCKSKKRFIKLLMSRGCGRKTAARMARFVSLRQGRQSYQALWFDFCFEMVFWEGMKNLVIPQIDRNGMVK